MSSIFTKPHDVILFELFEYVIFYLTHWGKMNPCDIVDLVQIWIRWWLVVGDTKLLPHSLLTLKHLTCLWIPCSCCPVLSDSFNSRRGNEAHQIRFPNAGWWWVVQSQFRPAQKIQNLPANGVAMMIYNVSSGKSTPRQSHKLKF